MFANEYRRRVERVQRLAAHIEQNAGWLKSAVERVAPDDMTRPLDPAGFARCVASDAAEIDQLLGQIDALREVAFIVDEPEESAS